MFEKQAKEELFETVKAFHACKQKDGQSVSSYLLKMKSYLDTLKRLGLVMPNELGVSLILNSLNKDYDQFIQKYNMHNMGKMITELHAILKLHEKGILKKVETPIVLAIREGRIQKDKKKSQGEKGKDEGKISLLMLPSPRSHCLLREIIRKRTPSATTARSGYIHTFTNYGIFVLKDKVFYFDAIPHDGIYEIDMHNLYPNHDGIFQPTHDEEKCKSCISGKMACKPFPHQVERAKDLLGLIHIDGYEALVKRDTPDKLDSISIKCIFVWYLKEAMGYYFYNLLENKIFVARNAEFFKNSLTLQEASGSHGLLKATGNNVGLELIQEDETQHSENTSKRHDEVEPTKVEPHSVEVPISRSERIPQAPDKYGEATYILRIKTTSDRSKRFIALSKSAYFDKILKKFKMDNSKHGSVPMQEKPYYRKSQGVKTPSEVKRMQRVLYDSAIGSLMYAVRCTRPDVAFA
nr:zinc finger, CCHC-type [Tanacetum cinerariifolium]